MGVRSRLRLQQSGDLGDEALKQAGETVLDLAAGLEDFVVAEGSFAEAGGEVGDAGDAEDFDAHVAGHDGFRDRGHADQGCAEGAEGEDFGWGFKARAGDGEIDAFGEREAFGKGGLLGEGAEALRVSLSM